MPTWLAPAWKPHQCSQAFQGNTPPKRTAWQSTHWEKATQGWKAGLGLSSCKAVTGRPTDTYSRNRQWDSCVIVWMKRADVQLTDLQALLARAVPVLSKLKVTNSCFISIRKILWFEYQQPQAWNSLPPSKPAAWATLHSHLPPHARPEKANPCQQKLSAHPDKNALGTALCHLDSYPGVSYSLLLPLGLLTK